MLEGLRGEESIAELCRRKLAVCFTDQAGYFVSEASVYRLLKAHDLITSPAFVVIKAADEFKDKTKAPNELWQADITYRAPRPGLSGVHMTGMQGEGRKSECLTPCCEGV